MIGIANIKQDLLNYLIILGELYLWYCRRRCDTYISTFCRNNKAKHKTESYSIQTKKVPEKMEIILNKGY